MHNNSLKIVFKILVFISDVVFFVTSAHVSLYLVLFVPFQVLGNWETRLTNCSAMTVDTDGGQIAIGGTGGDMKNVIRIYDLQV